MQCVQCTIEVLTIVHGALVALADTLTSELGDAFVESMADAEGIATVHVTPTAQQQDEEGNIVYCAECFAKIIASGAQMYASNRETQAVVRVESRTRT